MTMKSALSASRLRAVSLSVSPFLNEDASAEKLMMSARQPLRGQFKTDARARGRLDEQIDDRFAAQRRDFFDGALADGLEAARRVQHGDDFLRRERFDVEQMFFVPAHVIFPDIDFVRLAGLDQPHADFFRPARSAHFCRQNPP